MRFAAVFVVVIWFSSCIYADAPSQKQIDLIANEFAKRMDKEYAATVCKGMIASEEAKIEEAKKSLKTANVNKASVNSKVAQHRKNLAMFKKRLEGINNGTVKMPLIELPLNGVLPPPEGDSLVTDLFVQATQRKPPGSGKYGIIEDSIRVVRILDNTTCEIEARPSGYQYILKDTDTSQWSDGHTQSGLPGVYLLLGNHSYEHPKAGTVTRSAIYPIKDPRIDAALAAHKD